MMYAWFNLDSNLVDTTYYKLDDHFWTIFLHIFCLFSNNSILHIRR
jgi:hypothetical protein